MDYKYKHLPLTPKIVSDLIPLICKGIMKRVVIVELVVNYHKKNGGKDAETVDVDRTVKKGLEMCIILGTVKKAPTYGHWEIIMSESVNETREENVQSVENLVENATPIVEQDTCIPIGTGNNCVYAYTFPSHQQKAVKEYSRDLPIKVGFSQSKDPWPRIRAQTSTGNIEKPILLLMFYTNTNKLEKAFHYILRVQGRQHDNENNNKEWFITNEHHLLSLYHMIESGKLMTS